MNLTTFDNHPALFAKKVAIVVPMYKNYLTPDEQISFNHLLRYLNHYDKYLMTPETLMISIPGFKIKKFPDKYFKSAITNAELLSHPMYYSAFLDYEYIMLYHLDALVFSDQLMEWCSKGYDYIGAPWIKQVMVKRYDFPDAVGNGGFALRRVRSFLSVIESSKHPWRAIKNELTSSIKEARYEGLFARLYDLWRNTLQRTDMIEDRFWSFKAKNYYPAFKVASVEEGLKFAFEVGPRYCFQRNNNQLPFGCHAWARYDRKFWEPYLIKDAIVASPLEKKPN